MANARQIEWEDKGPLERERKTLFNGDFLLWSPEVACTAND